MSTKKPKPPHPGDLLSLVREGSEPEYVRTSLYDPLSDTVYIAGRLRIVPEMLLFVLADEGQGYIEHNGDLYVDITWVLQDRWSEPKARKLAEHLRQRGRDVARRDNASRSGMN